MRKTAFGAVLAVLTSVTVFGGVSAFAASPHANTPVTVSVSATNGSQVGTGFAGFSYEKNQVGADVFNSSDTNLVNLFRLLGPNVLRIGGNEVDRVNWNPNGAGGSALEIAPSDVTKLAGFIRATGWKVIYGIDLKLNTTANAASEALFASQALGSGLVAFEIGNEPDFYDTQAQYEASYSSYVSAIKAKVPGATFDGPGQGKGQSWVNTFGAHEKTRSLSILTSHIYVDSAANATISAMLASNNPGGKLQTAEATMNTGRANNGLPQWRMSETNSFFNGGTTGVSDVEAASLWSLDYLSGVAAHNGAGLNFHGGSTSKYTPIVFNGTQPTSVQGVYYGQLLWVLAGTGAYHSASVSGGSSITAWGIGKNVFVNNKSTSALTVTITLNASATTAHEYVLTAPALTSKSVTVAGSSVSVSGAFNPAPQSVSVSGTRVVINVPADSAALVVAQ